MLSFKIESSAALKDLERLDKHMRMAHAAALTSVAKLGEHALRTQVREVFDRPTPFTANSLYTRPATPGRLVAEVGFRSARVTSSHHYLEPQVHGGPRTVARFEFHLRSAGVLGQGEHVVPAKGYPLDAHGNVARNVYAGILSDLQAHPDVLARSTRESRRKRERRKGSHSKRRQYFAAPKDGKLPRGIYERVRFAWGSGVKGVFMFVQQQRYAVRLPMRAILTDVYDKHIQREMDDTLRRALATANTGGSSFARSLAWKQA